MKKIGLALSFIFIILSVTVMGAGCKSLKSTRTHYDITCTLSGNVLSGRQTVDFYNHTDNTVNEIKFNLHANAFRKGAKYSPIGAQYTSRAYPNGINYGEFSVKSTCVDGQSAEYSVCGEDQNILAVPLSEEIYPQERVVIEIDYTITLADVIARTGINSSTINLANFYPIVCGMDSNGFYECVYYSDGDPYFSDCADYSVTFSCDNKYTVASSGKLDKTYTNDNIISRSYTLNNARSFALILSENFETVTEISDGLEVNYYYYNDKNPTASFEYIKKSLEYFEKTFGDYPYPTYSVVQTKFMQGGMEFPALVMISDNLEEKAYGEVIVHETAHQWWQTGVGNNEVEYGFLDEGLAEYSVVLFYENHSEYGMDRQTLISSSERTYKVFCSVYDKVLGGVNTVMLRGLKDFTSEYEYVNIAYIKPCIMYDYLRKTIGDEMFFKGLKTYYKNYCFKNAEPYDIVGVYEKLGADANGFFRSFYDGKVII